MKRAKKVMLICRGQNVQLQRDLKTYAESGGMDIIVKKIDADRWNDMRRAVNLLGPSPAFFKVLKHGLPRTNVASLGK